MLQNKAKVASLLSAHKVQAKALGKALSVSVLNQVVSSVTNFVLGLYLVRTLTPAEFGLYGIGFAICLFYASIGNALFLTQMVVHTPSKAFEDRVPYAARIFMLLCIFCLASVVLMSIAIKIFGLYWVSLVKYRNLGFSVMVASVFFLIKDFFIRHAYNVRVEHWALETNLVVLFLLVCLLVATHNSRIVLNAESAIYIYASSNVAGVIYGFLRMRLQLFSNNIKQVAKDISEIINHGLWATVMTIAASLRGHSLTFIIALMVGSVGVAKINVARLFVTPILLMFPIVNQVLMPRMADRMTSSPRSTFLIAIANILLFASIAAIYTAVLLLFFDTLTTSVLANKFDTNIIYSLTILFLLHAFILSVRNAQELFLQVAKEFKNLALVHIVITLISYIAIFMLLKNSGLIFGVIGFITTEILLIIISSILIVLFIRKSNLNTSRAIIL
jgi:O-antigen/teichoic acid export membrane protein